MRKLFNKIKDYYLSNTELGRREVALNLDNNYICLTPDFPYYSDGIRSIEIKDKDYYFYVDLSFILYYFKNRLSFDGFLKFITSVSAFEIPLPYHIIVISNIENLCNLEFSYDNRILYNIDMSSHKILLDEVNSKHSLPLTEDIYLNWYDSGINLEFYNYSTIYSLLMTNSLEVSVCEFKKYFLSVGGKGLCLKDFDKPSEIRLLVFNYDLVYLNDFLFNVLNSIDKSILVRYSLDIEFILEKSKSLELLSKIDNWVKINKLTYLDYPDFVFIKDFKDNFHSLSIKI